jgi:phospholipid/cholesterol/gamma-HCH transport system substrate-binding protein
MQPNRERAIVGLFIAVCGVLLFGTLLAIWGGIASSGTRYRTFFKFAGGIQPGTAVRYEGLRIGRVERVQVDPTDTSRIEVDVLVDRRTPVNSTSVARVSSLGPLSDNYIEISAGQNGATASVPGSVLPSAETFNLAQLGDLIQGLAPQVQSTLAKLDKNLDGLQTTVARANDLLNDENRTHVSELIARADDLVNETNRTNLASSLAQIHQLLDDVKPKLSASLTNVQDVTGKMAPLLEDVKMATNRADRMLAHLDEVLAENRGDLHASLGELHNALSKSTALLEQLQEVTSENSGNIDDILANMRMTTENLRSLSDTVRASPASLIRGTNFREHKPGEIPK